MISATGEHRLDDVGSQKRQPENAADVTHRDALGLADLDDVV
jgi:hypothetical protein